MVLSLVALGIGIYFMVAQLQATLALVLVIVGPILTVLWIVLLVKKINPTIKTLSQQEAVLQGQIDKFTGEAYGQMQALNNLFYDGMSSAIMKKTIPLINLDLMFDSRRHDYLVTKFGLGDFQDPNRSALYVQSGDINGNPFYICNDLIHTLGSKTYTGSLTISWSERVYVNGKWVTQHRTQVLTASVEKPCPYYSEQPYLIYGNEAAPDLIFSREDSDAEKMSEKQIESHVNRKIKKMERLARKSINVGSNFTVMGNEEFEVLFNAPNRNNETQFRLLFTPLAQRQLLALMKDKTVGFGDEFDFIKHKMINKIVPHFLRMFQLGVTAPYFRGYDFDEMRKRFVDYNDAYFRHLYFSLAPVLAIPLYQQHKPHEYIYRDVYKSYVCFYEHEHIANSMNETNFKHPLSATRNILKTSTVKSGNFCDTIQVTAYGYKTVARTEYISRLGGDGRSHMVPVNWTEYIPVEKATMVDVKIAPAQEEKTAYDKVKQMVEDLRSGQASKQNVFMLGCFAAYIVDKKVQ
ncbi:MAG TPA: hypothetical protein DCX17_04450 [Firmicutes bacterium]|nr:hypothetical protein [Bacillota bacterium]